MDENVSCDDDVVNDLATLHMRLKSSQVNIDNAMANFMDLVELYNTFKHFIELNNLPETGISSKFAKHGRTLSNAAFKTQLLYQYTSCLATRL